MTDPKARAMAALEEAVDDLDAADGGNTMEVARAESDAVEKVVDAVAEALVDGMNESVGFFAGALADVCHYNNKTDLKQQIKDRVTELRDDGKEPLDGFMEDRLEKVTVVKTTDHKQGAQYIWDFGTFKVETKSGRDRRGHFAFNNFRNYIHESGGVNCARPEKDHRGGEEWRDFVTDLIDERSKEQRVVGPRTEAVEALSNKIKRLTGYGTPEGALDHTGVWVVCEQYETPDWWGVGQPFWYERPAPVTLPDWWAAFAPAPGRKPEMYPGDWWGNGDPRGRLPGDDYDLHADAVEQVRVHESVVKPILDDVGITRDALYHELDARGHTIPGMSGVSMSKWVDGSDERFWALLPDVGCPRAYVPDPTGTNPATGTLFATPDAEQTTAAAGDGGSERVEADDQEEPTTDDASGFDSVGETQ